MENEIKAKLVDALKGAMSEAVVTYALVKVRELIDFERKKIADTDPKVQELNLLKAYCDWTVHVDMAFNSRTKRFIKAIDDYIAESATATRDINRYKGGMEELYYLEDFRVRLSIFLNDEGLSSQVTDDHPHWVEFLKHYAGIIHNRSMRYDGADLRAINQVTFTTLAPSQVITLYDGNGTAATLPFGIQVNFTEKSGKVGALRLPDWVRLM